MADRINLYNAVIVSGLEDLAEVDKQDSYEKSRLGGRDTECRLVSLTYHPVDKYIAVFNYEKGE